ncbi:hypothetical protein D3C86_2171000 [compost metagenome]
MPLRDLALTDMALPDFIAATSAGSSAAFSTQAELPLVNITKVRPSMTTLTFEFSCSG